MKKTVSDLAILGGAAAFSEPLHVGRPNIPDRRRCVEALDQVLASGVLTNHGPAVQRFEQRLRERLGAPHIATVANATLGLMLAARALDLRGEVIVPSFTFVGTAHALHWQGITPVFCEVDPATYQMDPAHAEALVTPRTTGILAVHLFGRTCDVEALERIAAKRRLKLLVDAAQAVGCSRGGRPVAVHGDAAVFSFHATKVVNTFEGGAVATKDASLAEAVERMTRFGFIGYDRVAGLGINAKMSEPSAAMGLASLERLDDFVAHNRRNLEAYRRVLAGIPGLRLAAPPDLQESNGHYVVVDVDADAAGIPRDALLAVLHAENVLARRYFYPGCHRLEPYASSSPWKEARLPRTEQAAARVLVLPTGTAVGGREIEAVGNIFRVAVAGGPGLASRLPPNPA